MKEFRLAQKVNITGFSNQSGFVIGQGWHVEPFTPSPGYILMIPHVLVRLDKGFYQKDKDGKELGHVSILVVHPDSLEVKLPISSDPC